MTHAPPPTDFQRYAARALRDGYDEVLSRSWPPDSQIAEHTHPFAVRALIVAGEMWLTVGGETRHLRAGDEFTLAAGEVHAERYGWSGASYWVARRH